MTVRLIEIKFSEKKLQAIRQTLSGVKGAIPKVMSHAVNRTAESARTQIVRRLASLVNLKQKIIRDSVALSKASYRNWVATVGINTKRIPLINFGARQNKKGLSYIINKTSGRKQIKSAFIATMSSGHRGAFKRKGPDRLPIMELRGPSLGEFFRRAPTLTRQITREAYRNLERNIDTQVALILKRRKTG